MFSFPPPSGSPVNFTVLTEQPEDVIQPARTSSFQSAPVPSAPPQPAPLPVGGEDQCDRRFWMPDDACTVCYKCEQPFSLLRRRHHCRTCGLIFCRACSAHTVKGARVCDSCFTIARSSRPSQNEASHKAFQAAAAAAAEAKAVDATETFGDTSTRRSSSLDDGAFEPRLEGDGAIDESTPLFSRRASLRRVVTHTLSRGRRFVDRDNTARDYGTVLRERADVIIDALVVSRLEALRLMHPPVVLAPASQRRWRAELCRLARQACNQVHPRVEVKDNLDILEYVRVKLIPGGALHECTIVAGVVCRKNVAHRKMKSDATEPRILVLAGALVFHQGSPHRITSLDTLSEQEQQYFELVVDKIVAVGVDVLVVGSAVSRVAQTFLLKRGISLVYNVKPALITRIARLTGATVLPTTDHIVPGCDPTGTCERWSTRVMPVSVEVPEGEFRKEVATVEDIRRSGRRVVAYMYFEGCPPSLGCTVCLRGGKKTTLRHMKRILREAVARRRSLVLENALMLVMGARLLPSPVMPVRLTVADNDQRPTSNLNVTGAGADAAVMEFVTSNAIEVGRVWLRGMLQTCTPEIVRTPFYLEGDVSLGQFLTDMCFSPSVTWPSDASSAGTTRPGSMAEMDYSVVYIDGSGRMRIAVQHLDGPDNAGQNHHVFSTSAASSDGVANFNTTAVDLSSSNIPQAAVSEEDAARPNLGGGGGIHHARNLSTDSSKRSRGGSFHDADREAECQQVLTWAICNDSGEQTAVQRLTEEGASLSFAKYVQLMLRYEGVVYTEHDSGGPEHKSSSPLKHRRHHLSEQLIGRPSLFHDYTRFFQRGGLVATVEYERVVPYTSPLRLSVECGSAWAMADCAERVASLERIVPALIARFTERIEELRLGTMGTENGGVVLRPAATDGLDALQEAIRSAGQLFMSTLEGTQRGVGVLSNDTPITHTRDGSAPSVSGKSLAKSPESLASSHDAASRVSTQPAPDEFAAIAPLTVDVVRCKLFVSALSWNDRLQEIASQRNVQRKREPEREKKMLRLPTAWTVEAKDEAKPSAVGANECPSTPPERGSSWSDRTLDVAEETARASAASTPQRTEQQSNEEASCDYAEATSGNDVASEERRHSDAKGVQSGTEPWGRNLAVDLPELSEGHLALPNPPSGIAVLLRDDEPTSWIAHALVTEAYTIELERRVVGACEINGADNQGIIASLCLNGGSTRRQDASARVAPENDDRSCPEKGLKAEPSLRSGSDDSEAVLEQQWDLVLRGTSYGAVSSRGGRTRGVAQGSAHAGSKGALSADIDLAISDDTEGCSMDCSVRVYYAAQFHALRRLFLRDSALESEEVIRCAERCYLESLSRCSAWGATGGKTKARFFKTKDGRFVVKSVSQDEIDMLHACAPKYFEYLGTCTRSKTPSVLSKIFGVYTVTIQPGVRNHSQGKKTTLSLVVMENMLWRRKLSHVFDLKGNQRNRYVRPPLTPGQVLQDMNFFEVMAGLPLSLQSAAKHELVESVTADAEFLSSLGVVDYSMLVGIDDERRELVVGIIDYLQLYSIKKMIEHQVKKAGSQLTGQAEPTIVSPRKFRILK